MRYLYLDFETRSTLNLTKVPLRDYLSHGECTYLSWAIDDGPIHGHRGGNLSPYLPELRELFGLVDVTVVAFNASFDARCAVYLLGLPFPRRLLCAMELAGLCWPNQPGGYGLGNLACQLGLTHKKGSINFDTCTDAELAIYCQGDVIVLRELFQRELPLASKEELDVCALSNAAKAITLIINQDAVASAAEALSLVSGSAALRVAQSFGDTSIFKAYGWHGETIPNTLEEAGTAKVKSVKPHEVKRLLMEHFAIDFAHKSISVKKINPTELATMNAQARGFIQESSTINKALSHHRRLGSMSHMREVDAEINYAAAHTLRWSSKNQSKGINLHNLPKHDKRIAEPLRRCITLPPGKVFVRADLANVEYRGECLLSGCRFGSSLFESDPFADPYSAFGTAATGLTITKSSYGALRQLFKTAVLGLGYLMGIHTWLLNLSGIVADPEKNKVCLQDIIDLAATLKLSSMSPQTKRAVTKIGCHHALGLVGQYVRDHFHNQHPEFGRLARWLDSSVQRLSVAYDVGAAIESCYLHPCAPPRDLISLTVDRSLAGTSIRCRVGGWPASVVWRDVAIRDTVFGPRCTSIRAGSRPPRAITPNILIENVVQHWARNVLAQGLLHLNKEFGYAHILHVHDEILLVVDANRAAITNAKEALVRTFGPGNPLGWKWAAFINPAEVCVSRSFYEDEGWNSKVFWPRFTGGDDTVIQEIT
jgi:hypothetical protein